MAVTRVGFAAARLAVTYWVRPNLASPVHETLALAAGSGPGCGFGFGTAASVHLNPPQVDIPNAWVYSTAVVDKAGQAPTSHHLELACPALGQLAGQLAGGGKGSGGGISILQDKAQFHESTVKLATSSRTIGTAAGKPLLAFPVGRESPQSIYQVIEVRTRVPTAHRKCR